MLTDKKKDDRTTEVWLTNSKCNYVLSLGNILNLTLQFPIDNYTALLQLQLAGRAVNQQAREQRADRV